MVIIIISGVQKNNLLKEFPSIEIAYYVSQIIASLFMIAGTVVAVWQYYLSSRSNITQMQFVQAQKAIDLAEYYKDKILHRYTVIHYVYQQSGITEILDKIKPCDMKRFDSYELHSLLLQSDIEKLKEIQGSQKFEKAILSAVTMFNLKLNIKEKTYRGKKENEQMMEKDANTLLVSFLANIINELLNSVEFFAMHFCYNIADESVIYRSLHQTYLKMIQELYYSIAITNVSLESQYYTNIVKLYHEWNNKNKKEARRLNKKLKLNYGTVVNKCYNRAPSANVKEENKYIGYDNISSFSRNTK